MFTELEFGMTARFINDLTQTIQIMTSQVENNTILLNNTLWFPKKVFIFFEKEHKKCFVKISIPKCWYYVRLTAT